MSFFRHIHWVFFCLVAVLIMSTSSFSGDASLKITDEGKVNVDGVFHLEPLSEAPENPEGGDFYYNAENKELMFYCDSMWNKVTLTPLD